MKQLTIIDLQESENCLIRMIQKKYFGTEIEVLKSISYDGKVKERTNEKGIKKH